jgi:hypothetical protein
MDETASEYPTAWAIQTDYIIRLDVTLQGRRTFGGPFRLSGERGLLGEPGRGYMAHEWIAGGSRRISLGISMRHHNWSVDGSLIQLGVYPICMQCTVQNMRLFEFTLTEIFTLYAPHVHTQNAGMLMRCYWRNTDLMWWTCVTIGPKTWMTESLSPNTILDPPEHGWRGHANMSDMCLLTRPTKIGPFAGSPLFRMVFVLVWPWPQRSGGSRYE